MTDATIPARSGRRSWLRLLLISAGALAGLLIVLYLVVTSGAFFKGFILPRAGKAMKAEITVADASISPFSQVVLKQLSLKTTGAEPLLVAEEVRLRYRLTAILRGNFKVDEITLASPVFQLTRNADGTSNLDPLLQPAAKPAPTAPAKAGPPPKLDIRNVTLRNGTFRFTRILKDGTRELAETSGVNLALDRLTSGEAGTLTASALLKLDRPGLTAGSLQSKAEGKVQFRLAPDLWPESIQSTVTHDVLQATGSFAALAGQRTALEADLTATEIRKFTVSFTRGGAALGAIQVSGPFDSRKLEGQLTFDVKSIDRQALDLVGAPFGLGFDNTQINAAARLQLSAGGQKLALAGSLNVARFSVTREQKTTPVVDLNVAIDAAVDVNGQSVRVDTLKLDGTQGGQPLLRGALSQPMPISWGAAVVPGDSVFDLELVGLKLADWRAFTGDAISGGQVAARARLGSTQGGKRMDVDASGRIAGLSLRLGTNRINNADVSLGVKFALVDLQKLTLQQSELALTHSGAAVASATATGAVDRTTGGAFQTKLGASVPALLGLMPQPGARFSAGTIELTGTVAQTNATGHGVAAAAAYTIAGNARLNEVTGTIAESTFNRLAVEADYDATFQQDVLSVRKLNGSLRQGDQPGGTFQVTGRYDLGKQAGEVGAKLAGLNQNFLRPFLEPALAGNTLVAVTINADTTAKYDTKAGSELKATATVTNLVVADARGQRPTRPLAASLQIDVTQQREAVNLRQALLRLSPTDRARNELQLSGRVDLARTNPTPSELALRAESLDLTPFLDLLGTAPASPATKPAPTPSSTTTPLPPGEPDPVAMPIQQLTLDAKVDRAYLRELAISNWVARAQVNGGRVLLKPFELTLNGTPVSGSADIDLGVRGWRYDAGFNVGKLAVEPIANTFAPDQRGQYRGTLEASGQIRGAGFTGASLRKTLGGQFAFGFTNANVQLMRPKTKSLVVPIAAILRISEITNSPLNWILARGDIANGAIALHQLTVQSDAFEARSQGAIPIEAVLTNSPLNFPVDFWLRRRLADKAGLTPANTPTNVAYVQLPQFVTVRGTLGQPKSDVKELALGGMVLKSGVAIAEQLGVKMDDKTSSTLRNIGGLLMGEKAAPAATNAPGVTNAPAGSGQPATVTNRLANTNAPPGASNQPSLLNLLDLLNRPKK